MGAQARYRGSVSNESEPYAATLHAGARPAMAANSITVSSALIWAGVALFVIGLLSILVTFAVPLFDLRLSSAFYYLSMLAPAGMIVGVIGALASGRRAR